MIIELNGDPHEMPEGTSLAALIETATGTGRGSAAAVDGLVVPRGDWSGYRLTAGQCVELLTAVPGG
jgi:sulfur carrier protein